MREKEFALAYKSNFLGHWTQLTTVRKPIIAAVSGHALGGGCELAMMCDIILAAHNANFGQPEINLGVIPGAGGTQRLTKAIGKSLAMELTLTGRGLTAQEAEKHGLVSRVVSEGGDVVAEAVKLAATIAKRGDVSLQAAKEAINASFDLPLQEGLRFERRLFQALFATKDQKEGMSAFVEKRKVRFVCRHPAEASDRGGPLRSCFLPTFRLKSNTGLTLSLSFSLATPERWPPRVHSLHSKASKACVAHGAPGRLDEALLLSP